MKKAHLLTKNDICVCLSLKAMIEQYWEKIGIALSKSSANLWVLRVQPGLPENHKKLVESGLPGLLLFWIYDCNNIQYIFPESF